MNITVNNQIMTVPDGCCVKDLCGIMKKRENDGVAIAVGMERLLLKCKSLDCWGGKSPNFLVVCPPPLGAGFHDEVMGNGCVEKSLALPPYLEAVALRNGAAYMNAADCEFNAVDFTHLSRRGHAQLAAKLAELVPQLVK